MLNPIQNKESAEEEGLLELLLRLLRLKVGMRTVMKVMVNWMGRKQPEISDMISYCIQICFRMGDRCSR